MADVVLVLIVLVFFGACVLYVRCCDRMIRDDDTSKDNGDPDTAEPAREVAR